MPTAALLLALTAALPQEPGADLAAVYAEFFADSLELFPVLATEAGVPGYDDRFPDHIAEEHRAAQRALHTRYLARVEGVDRDALGREARLDLDLFRHQRRSALAELAWPDHLVPVDHHNCVALDFADIGSGAGPHPFETVADYEHFLGRVDGFEAWCETAIDNLARGMEQGIVVPKLTARLAAQRLRAHVVADPRDSVFYRPIANLPETIEAEDRERLEAAYLETIEERLVPLYRMLAEFVEEEYLPECRDSLAWTDMPDGAAWYAHLVRHYTTTDLTPDEVFALGEREVARIGPLLLAARERASAQPPTVYATADEVAAAYRARLDLAREHLDALFDVAPRTPLEILPADYGTYYQPGAPDGSRPGVFRFQFSGPTPISEATFVHEAIPGHHYQMMLQRESPQPDFRKHHLYFAFVEGWGLYAESLGGELGLYRDPHQEVARLHSEMWRALRLVWDVGIHARGWSLERCAEYGKPWGFGELSDIRWELERYVAWPGQALSYKVGELRISLLRDRARAALGEAFDPRAFHALVLRTGAVPLDLLEERVDEWIAEER